MKGFIIAHCFLDRPHAGTKIPWKVLRRLRSFYPAFDIRELKLALAFIDLNRDNGPKYIKKCS